MTGFTFRALVLLHIAFLLASACAGLYFPELLPADLQAAYAEAAAASPLETQTWSWLILVPLFAAMIAGYIGLFLFRRWGRSICLITTIIGMGLYPLFGPAVLSWLESALADVSNLLWGALLALAYFGPIRARFGDREPHAPVSHPDDR
jgi:hypothetical protein